MLNWARQDQMCMTQQMGIIINTKCIDESRIERSNQGHKTMGGIIIFK